MLIISHRGNIDGPSKRENTCVQIARCLALGLGVEVDVWGMDGSLKLGHDNPGDEIPLFDSMIIYHCKNLEAADICRRLKLHYFIHDRDMAALTSWGFIWTKCSNKIFERSIACLPEKFPSWEIKDAYGVCTDYPLKYK